MRDLERKKHPEISDQLLEEWNILFISMGLLCKGGENEVHQTEKIQKEVPLMHVA